MNFANIAKAEANVKVPDLWELNCKLQEMMMKENVTNLESISDIRPVEEIHIIILGKKDTIFHLRLYHN
jgi:hypothetical protein